jgi:hypothetical protein
MRLWLRALLLFVFGAALFSFPAWTVRGHAAVGAARGEVWRNVWLLWAAPHAWFGGGPPLARFALLVDPAGANLWPHVRNLVWPAALAPVTLTLGPIAAHNLGLAVALFLNALCSWLFLRRVLDSATAALPPAMALGFGSVALNEAAAGRAATAGFFVVPLAAWAALRVCEKRTFGRVAALAAAFAFAALWDVCFALSAVLFAAAVAGWTVRTNPGKGPLVAVGGAALAAAVAWLAAIWALTGSPPAPDGAAGALPPGASLDLLEPVFFARAYADATPYFLILVALLALFHTDKRQILWWLGAAFVLFLLTLGPDIRIWGRPTGFPAGWCSPIWRWLGWPIRFLPAAHLALAIPAGLALRTLLQRMELDGRESAVVSSLVLAALTVSFFRVPLPAATSGNADAPLLTLDEPGAVLALPARPEPAANARYLFFQTLRPRPALVAQFFDGAPAGFPPAAVAAAPVLAALGRYPLDPAALAALDAARLRADLAALGVRYVALHTDDLPEFSRDEIWFWHLQAFGVPEFQSRAMTLFQVR